jgi:hypothetical protein
MALEAESSTTPSFGEMLTWGLLQARSTPARHSVAVKAPRSTYKVPRTLDGRVIPVARAFECLGEANPLRRLSNQDQELVWANLMFFQIKRDERIRGPLKGPLEELEGIAKAASDAANLAAKIEEFLQNDCGEVLNRRLTGFGCLPTLLKSFASKVNGDGLLSAFGETRFKRARAFEDQLLIHASQLVLQKTGSWNDEHLAELYQSMRSDLGRDFSGEAIRRRRERFKKEHPKLYNLTVLSASREHKGEGQHRGRSVAGKPTPRRPSVRRPSKRA